MSDLLEWRKHDSHSEICPTEFGPYMVEDTGSEVWAWLPDQQQQARRRVNSGSVKGAKDLCQEDVDTRRSLRDCAPYLTKGETPAQRIEREFNDSQFLLGKLASSQAQIERLKEALTPSADTKAAYIGEFSMGVVLRAGGEEEHRRIDIPWTTIKEIMAAILAKAGTT